MGLFEQLPYTNFHDLNLTELVKLVKAIAEEMHNFEVVNQISYGGQWDITKAYQKYTIVTVNGTDGYISLKPVPIGVNYTNTEYWGIVADFTTALAGLGSRVADLENDNVINKANITQLQSDVKKAIPASQNMSVVVLGDSYGYCDYLTGTPYPNNCYIKVLQNKLHLDSDHYHYNALNGGRMGGGSYSMVNILNALPTFTNESDVDLVITQCGVNDRNDTTLISSGIDAYATAVKTRFPNAKLVHFLTIGSFTAGDTGSASDVYAFNDMINTIRSEYVKACNDNNIELIDDTIIPMLIKDNFYSDLYHPSASCHSILASIMSSAINGNVNYPISGMYENNIGITLTNADINICEMFKGRFWYKNRKLLDITAGGRCKITFTTPQTVTSTDGQAPITIGYFNNIRVCPTIEGWENDFTYKATIRVGSTFYDGAVRLRIKNGAISIAPWISTPDGNGWLFNVGVSDIYFMDENRLIDAIPG